jgi:hypothetical protein
MLVKTCYFELCSIFKGPRFCNHIINKFNLQEIISPSRKVEPIPPKVVHYPVFWRELLEIIEDNKEGREKPLFLDCTLGTGGHALKVL